MPYNSGLYCNNNRKPQLVDVFLCFLCVMPVQCLTHHSPLPLPCNEDILQIGRLMADGEAHLTNPKPPDSSGNFTRNLPFFHRR